MISANAERNILYWNIGELADVQVKIWKDSRGTMIMSDEKKRADHKNIHGLYHQPSKKLH